VSYVALLWSVTDDDRRQQRLLVWPPTLCVGGPVIIYHSFCGECRGVDPLPKLGVFKCVRLPDMQSQKRHHNVTSQNDVTRTEQNRLGISDILVLKIFLVLVLV